MEAGVSRRNSDSGTSTGSKLGICEVCAAQEAKYTCPRCEVKTCCLKCSNIHKTELKCSGERNRTKYVPLNEFTNLDLHSDYCLLEEVSRSVESSRKKFGKIQKFSGLPPHLFKLRAAAISRRINLKFLPFQFVRHIQNTTYLHFKLGIIHWHIEWVFVNADNLILSDVKVPENYKLSSVVSKYFLPQDDKVISEKLQYYQAAGLSGVKLYLKAERKPRKFYELDPDSTLQENLQKKMIIEYPVIHVVLKDHGCGYDVVDSDDEDVSNEGSTIKTGNEVINNIIEKDNQGDKSLKNLLFCSEYSDGDNSD